MTGRRIDADRVLHPDDRVPERGVTAFRDYILTDYTPLVDPTGRLRSESVYRWALREAGLLEAAWPAVEAVRAHLGRDKTVWGIKWGPRGFTSELYFYNNALNPANHPMQATTLSRVMSPWLAFDAWIDERWRYFMCSVDLDERTLSAERVGWHLYLGTGDQGRKQCGFSYRVEGDSTRLENHYWFYDPSKEMGDIRLRLGFSPRVPEGTALLDHPAIAPLVDCHTLCIAVKPEHEGLYAARVSTAQARRFFEAQPVAAAHPLATLLGALEDDLAHLRWDVGFDVRPGPGDQVAIDKVALYGVL